MKRLLVLIACLFSSFLAGCTVMHIVNPVTIKEIDSKEMCIIANTEVREEFLVAYKAALVNKGFSVKVIDSSSDVDSCSLTSTYLGKWSWDFVTYMAYAEIIVYRNGVKVGDAVYRAPRAGLALTTKIYEPTDKKLVEMVDQLFLEF